MKKYNKPEIRIEIFDNEYIGTTASGMEYVDGLNGVQNRMMINYDEMVDNIKFVI